MWFRALSSPRIFDKHHALSYELSQTELIYAYQRDISVVFPLETSFISINRSFTGLTTSPITGTAVRARRFVESSDTWNNLRKLGTPKDSYGMNYTIPIGMASIERLSGIPMYVGTPHCYGNELWGGKTRLPIHS